MMANPSRVPTVRVLASQIASTMGAPKDRENINLGVTASTMERVPPLDTEIAGWKAKMASRNQPMDVTTMAKDGVCYRSLKECQRRPKL